MQQTIKILQEIDIMKPLSQEEIIKDMHKIIEYFPRADLEKAQTKFIDKVKLGSDILAHIEVPFITSDKDIQRYVHELQLNKPENLIRFYLEASLAPARSLCEDINDLKRTDLYNTIAPINSSANTYFSLILKLSFKILY